MTATPTSVDEARHIKANGSPEEVAEALQSLLGDHMKLVNHLRELRMAGCAAHIADAQHAEIDEAAHEVLYVMEQLQAAIRELH